ncbi:hypothetical protein [Brevibacillus fulvus]|uniref:Uncharacterized protein n=1 Tax=Brevibacillus fulvus TaxID=1125967 RepID=A0A938XWP4_9BACL|nr:hypothetical protein [Brevibacillus fulvus]MBM7589070.1 hypothetical protein [Brevibacillus fulvus]
MAKREERSAMTARQAAEQIQNSSPDSAANLTSTEFASEQAAANRQQNQMFSAPGKRSAENETTS